jgi:hypothetical protein
VPIVNGLREALQYDAFAYRGSLYFPITDSALLFRGTCTELSSSGLRCVDLVGVLFWPVGSVLWQLGRSFLLKNSPVFPNVDDSGIGV